MLTNYLLTARQRLQLFCIAQQPGLDLVDNNIHFSNPEHNPHNDKNTRVTVTNASTVLAIGVLPEGGTGYSGTPQKVYMDNNVLVGNINVSIPVHMRKGALSIGISNLTEGADVTLRDLDIQITQM